MSLELYDSQVTVSLDDEVTLDELSLWDVFPELSVFDLVFWSAADSVLPATLLSTTAIV